MLQTTALLALACQAKQRNANAISWLGIRCHLESCLSGNLALAALVLAAPIQGMASRPAFRRASQARDLVYVAVSLPFPFYERERERERERESILAQVSHLCLEACAASLHRGGDGGLTWTVENTPSMPGRSRCRLQVP